GYSEEEISSAYSWLLKRFDHAPYEFYAKFPERRSSLRVLTSEERGRLTADACGLLLQLSRSGVVDQEQFETILDRVATFWSRPVTLDQFKLIAASVIFSELDEEDAPQLFDAEGDFTGFTN
ncbi:MAG: DUF494 family protein, partial [Candidatus Zixiibacteriota bacterium]